MKVRKLGALLLAISISFVSFGVPVEADTNVQLNGIDVSNHNGDINWTAVKKSGVDFAMIRDGYGGDPGYWDTQEDARFEQNYSGAVAAGLKVGAYHYSYATDVASASNEADECLHILNGRHLDYPVAYDVEDPSQYGLSADMFGQIIQTFCSKLQQAGYKTMVYTYKNFYTGHFPSSLASQYDMWIATRDMVSPGISPCPMWQYSSTASVSGVSGGCDADFSYVDYASGGGSNKLPLDPLLFVSDTSAYTFGSNRTYTYKITTADTYPPTATSSNSSAVTVSGPTQTYGGFLFTLTNVGAGSAVITTTAGDGRSVSFTATGSAQATALQCDTSSYKFGTNSAYYYKITTTLPNVPSAVSSDTSVATVSYSQKLSDGYLYKITNVGAGVATITTTASDGSSASFPVMGASVQKTFSCDTSSYTFSNTNAYYYKITTSDAITPTAVSSNSTAVSVAFAQKLADGYLFKITNAGAGTATITTTASDGTSVSFPATGNHASPLDSLRSDTPYNFSMKTGSYYQFKFTGDPSVSYQFTSANGDVVRPVYQNKLSGSYYFKIYAAGAGCCGVYASAGSLTPQRVAIVRVA